MDIRFCGGAQTVTGSQFLLSVNGKNILLECGLFQGRRQESYEKNMSFLFPPAAIDAVVLSHAHMDHAGNLPNLVKHGFRGLIFATPATAELCKIMLRDSAFLQSKDLEWVNKIRKKHGQPPALPLYSPEEAEAAMEHFTSREYDIAFPVAPGISVTFYDAGHILGAAGVFLEISEKGRTLKLGFSGDVGRSNIPVIRDPNIVRDVDALIIETTYGNRHHHEFADVEEELATVVRETTKTGGKIIIPSFAVGRTQLLVYLLHKLFNQDRIPEIPIYVDSPLAMHATEIFRAHPELMDRETERVFLSSHEDPFDFRRLTYITDVEESKKLNHVTFPHIIIAGSGMCEGGRVLHHLRNSIDNPNNLILFVGYAAKETLARRIMDGNQVVRIFGEEHRVACKIKAMDSFSAHGDRRDLLNYVRMTPPEKLKNVFLVHGEPEQALSFRDALRSNGYMNVHYPALGDTISL
ncbi:MAG: MBL fold metallo-hydrolase [Candidatus Raymondbacteria bacterium RifOxyC12_full_50_8]|uniref:MBL fold metallo-hydrolase n=1 Tax=Candidatus Raymondbacteria bacterium RIFOXYD12_FULL_49_13 TaxID=1817890 RepID=A0A1F7FF96_UNCRA|nr:MAG: MBL fold metallo-hydrolase [Candidatus Raymondbacteria bacterium RIFOXYA2_FULL_49_16]OGK01018.1 MAG: MBL fold metallo-hydrolase [Candidatus Raymondbacteria bacterium RifOxyB12_full_50_8]OGK03370.1 MAG: MBL fold metallo-hydrolase [Candidatus Raymondbacteria bacterium RifOxyC12_full_50_8]OGK05364.1 MAG: MBL fold metallo-hydrolase [Candidatus Raymondbacteria bacterium RIFOXYD12_FULL_49_13]OGP42977.1 MAG: MBL fold metallo-hydrolase [Candidatus Raymondbacteria bacterium RIFOXYB2_FULL_49_35]